MRARISFFSMILAVVCGVTSSARAIEPDESGGAFAQADVYPSRRAAVERLVTQAIDAIKAESDQTSGHAFRVIPVGATEGQLKDVVVKRLELAFADVRVAGAEGSSAASNDAMTVELDATDKSTVSLTIRGGKSVGTRVFATKFVDKPWADDWSVFRNANAAKRYLLATSSTPGATEAEAIASAQKEAVEQLAPIMTETIRANAARFRGEKIPVSQTWIRERLLSSIKRNNDNILVSDSFVQKFARPYGDVYQASLLVDASQKSINKLADGYNEYARAMASKQTTTQRTTFGATAGILLVVVLLYAFLNTVTKGYFLWRLRATALLIAIAGVLAVFAAHA